MTTRIPFIRLPRTAQHGGSIQSRSRNKADRLLGQGRVSTPSISVAATVPLHFQSDFQQRRFSAISGPSNSSLKRFDDDLLVRPFSATSGDATSPMRDDTNQVCFGFV